MLHLLATTLCCSMLLTFSSAEYQCLCIFDNHVHPIYQEPNVTSHVIGFLPPNQCKYYLYPVNAEFGAIMTFHQKGFIHMNTPGMKYMCEGKPLVGYVFTTQKPVSRAVSRKENNLTLHPTITNNLAITSRKTTPMTYSNISTLQSTVTPTKKSRTSPTRESRTSHTRESRTSHTTAPTKESTTSPSTEPATTRSTMPTPMHSIKPTDMSTTPLSTTLTSTPLTTPTATPSTTPSTTSSTTPPTTSSTTPFTTPSTMSTSTPLTMSNTIPSTTSITTSSTSPSAIPSTMPSSTPSTMSNTTLSTRPTTTLSTTPAATPSSKLTTILSVKPTSTTTPSTTVIAASSIRTHDQNKVPEGHIEICPEYIRNTDVNRFGGFLGQYGDFCYELVDSPTQFNNAERHCALVSSGHLVHVLEQDVQDYLVRFLSKHHYVQTVWLGLTDSGKANEGTWRWNSGAPFKYNNFQGDYTQDSSHTHTLNDCAVLKQGGEWTDVPCGITFVLGLGTGEKHPYICQYNISASVPSIMQAFPDVVVG